MSLATFKADNEKHREIVKMFVGCETESGDYLGFHKYYMDGRFATQHNCSFHTMYSDKITIDLDKAEMDLRLAIGTDIEFDTKYNKRLRIEQVTKYSKSVGYGLWKNGQKMGEFETEKIQLSKDYLERIGVEAGE